VTSRLRRSDPLIGEPPSAFRFSSGESIAAGSNLALTRSFGRGDTDEARLRAPSIRFVGLVAEAQPYAVSAGANEARSSAKRAQATLLA
jgi:hypothetical protein